MPATGKAAQDATFDTRFFQAFQAHSDPVRQRLALFSRQGRQDRILPPSAGPVQFLGPHRRVVDHSCHLDVVVRSQPGLIVSRETPAPRLSVLGDANTMITPGSRKGRLDARHLGRLLQDAWVAALVEDEVFFREG